MREREKDRILAVSAMLFLYEAKILTERFGREKLLFFSVFFQ